METYRTTITSVLIGRREIDEGEEWPHFLWTLTLTREGKTRDMPYLMGVGHQQTLCGKPKPSMQRFNVMPCHHVRCERKGYVPTPPDLYSVITSLKADAVRGESFTEWAEGLGYDTDSIKAREMYFACQNSETESERFFGEDWIKILADEDYV